MPGRTNYIGFSLILLLLGGCHPKAYILLDDASEIEDKIVRSTTTTIYTKSGHEIPRERILEIDHPGNVAALAGTSAALVLAPIAYVFSVERDNCKDFDCFGAGFLHLGALYSAIGCAGIGLWGWIVWGTSRSAASPADEPAKPKVAPVALSDGWRTYYGMGITFHW